MSPILHASLIAYAVTLACVLTPGIHFLTGIPGPLIGGIVGGLRARSQASIPRTTVLVGALLGLLMALTATALGGPAFLVFRALGLLEDRTIADFLLVPLVVGGYATVLGIAGTFIGALIATRPDSPETSPP